MGSFSGLGIGLSFLFGCILMGLVAELYYLLWWKKKLAKATSINSSTTTSSGGGEFQEFNLLFFWRRPRSFETAQETQNDQELQDLEVGPASKEAAAGLKCEEGIEAELMRVHNLCGPPRFLFTIKEESREDLESEEGRSRKGGSRTRSLSGGGGGGGGTPFLTPLSSPTTLRAAANSLDCYNHHGVNPLFESVPEAEAEAEFSRLRSSPPPKFKFLRDAEEKLMRRLMKEEEERRNLQDSILGGEKFGSFVKFLSVREQGHSQVLPLPSSPPLEHRV